MKDSRNICPTVVLVRFREMRRPLPSDAVKVDTQSRYSFCAGFAKRVKRALGRADIFPKFHVNVLCLARRRITDTRAYK